MCEAAAQAQQCRDRLEEEARAGSLPLSDPAQPYGILMAEATRLTAEFQHTCDVLQHGVDEARAASTAPAAGSGHGKSATRPPRSVPDYRGITRTGTPFD
ncbi:hypothetical protein GCM10010304_77500 [Streptomyces roseoviolaceus]